MFAPTNAAFAALPAGTVDTLLKPENKAKLTKILTYHVVAAKAMSPTIAKMIDDDSGTHPVKTVGGCELQAKMPATARSRVTDENGNVADRDHRRRQAVERRHPRHRQGAAAEGLIRDV